MHGLDIRAFRRLLQANDDGKTELICSAERHANYAADRDGGVTGIVKGAVYMIWSIKKIYFTEHIATSLICFYSWGCFRRNLPF